MEFTEFIEFMVSVCLTPHYIHNTHTRGWLVQAPCKCIYWLIYTWYGMVWSGIVWYGIVWFGMVWSGEPKTTWKHNCWRGAKTTWLVRLFWICQVVFNLTNQNNLLKDECFFDVFKKSCFFDDFEAPQGEPSTSTELIFQNRVLLRYPKPKSTQNLLKSTQNLLK